jgi:hypothetical protein
MGSKKGQLFLVAIVFMIGMVFVVQQALFQYSSLQMSQPFEKKEPELLSNMVDVVNYTIRQSQYCNETKDSFQARMESVRNSMISEQGREYSVEMVYDLDCSKWQNSSPNPAPLRITISVSGQGRDMRGTYFFYHF